MALRLEAFADIGLDEAMLRALLAAHERERLPRLRRLWEYYRNPASCWSGVGRTATAQERGLPARLRGARPASGDDRDAPIREVVIENDIAWRVQALVDFLVGRPVTVVSLAREEGKRREIEAILDAALEASGGAGLLQDAALLGAVYGYVDLLVRAEALFGAGGRGFERALALAGRIVVEPIEPTRGAPLLRNDDYRRIDAMVVRYEREGGATAGRAGALRLLGGRREASRRRVEVLEIVSASRWQRYEDGALTLDAPNRLGETPVVHVQNLREPFSYEGGSEVEPLIPLQDELNTRLSDRANRVTMQSFQMYLVKGLTGLEGAPIAPGQAWFTENPDASVSPFGGDAASPSERDHVEELREAMDKVSSVTPVAAGVLRSRLGNLSSENALRITLIGALSKTQRKRATYGRGIAEVCRLILRALDGAGIYRTDERDRGVRLVWPEPLPRDEGELLDAAAKKAALGVPRDRVLAELGYAPGDPGVS